MPAEAVQRQASPASTTENDPLRQWGRGKNEKRLAQSGLTQDKPNVLNRIDAALQEVPEPARNVCSIVHTVGAVVGRVNHGLLLYVGVNAGQGERVKTGPETTRLQPR
jgi:hypothetical protein